MERSGRKIAGVVVGGVFAALFLSVSAFAYTITFDEFGAGTSITGSTYASRGVHFSSGTSGTSPQGTIMAGGTWGLTGLGPGGAQFAGWSTVGSLGGGYNSGFQVTFDSPVSEFSIDFAKGTGSDVTGKLMVQAFDASDERVYDADWVFAGEGSWNTCDLTGYLDFYDLSIKRVTMLYFTEGTPMVGFDNMTFNVPVPASLLLLCSGLVPLALRRKK